MHLLMIGLDGKMLAGEHGGTIQRHQVYADRIGRLSIVTYNPPQPHREVRRVSANFTVYPTHTRRAFFPWAAYRVAARLMHTDNPPDVVSTQDPFSTALVGWWLKKRYGVALNIQAHSHFFENPHWLAEHPLRNRAFYALAKFLVPRADTCRVPYESEKQLYARVGVPAERIYILPVPIHLEKFATPQPSERLAALRAELGVPQGAPLLLWVGVPTPPKNIDLLLAAFERVRQTRPEAYLALVGDWRLRPDLPERAQRIGHVLLTGVVAHAELPLYYQAADLYVHTSRYEGAVRVFREALAGGTPVVSTDQPGARAIVLDGESGLITPHTPSALAEAILRLLAEPQRLRAMGQAGKQDVLRRFDYEKLMARWERMYRDTLCWAKEGAPCAG